MDVTLAYSVEANRDPVRGDALILLKDHLRAESIVADGESLTSVLSDSWFLKHVLNANIRLIIADDTGVEYVKSLNAICSDDFSGTKGILKLLAGDEPEPEYAKALKEFNPYYIERVKKNFDSAKLIVISPKIAMLEKRIHGTNLEKKISKIIITDNAYKLHDEGGHGFYYFETILKGLREYKVE